MNNLPDSSINPNSEKREPSRYKAIRELGHNADRSRVTYLAIDNATQQQVVIKQFLFAQSDSQWAGLTVYQREIKVLLELEHPGIPRYLNVFERRNGFCLVQEYKNLQSLGEPRQLEPEKLVCIAISLLEILVYLQDRTSPIIHRNIKPENILLDENLNVYLTDFSFFYIGKDGSIKRNTAGTMGFMPREQLRNGPLTEASDLYSLGVTIACVMMQTPSSKIDTLMDANDRLNFSSPKVPKEISHHFIEWLEKITEPVPNKRYHNAAAALEALKLIDIRRSPEVKLRPTTLEFTATQYGEKLTQTVTIVNSTPDLTLKGFWKVATHPKESRLSPHPWISFNPAQFEGNKITCEITIDTQKLMADKIYKREILLEINASQTHHSLPIQVTTAPIAQKLPQRSLGGLFLLALAGGWIGSLFVSATGGVTSLDLIQLIAGMAIGGAGGVGAAFNYIPLFGGTGTLIAVLSQVPFAGLGMIGGYFIGLLIGAVTGYVVRYNFGKELQSGLSALISAVFSLSGSISFLIATFGFSLGVELIGGFHLLILLALAATGIPLGMVLYRLYVERSHLMDKYRKFEPRLIKP